MVLALGVGQVGKEWLSRGVRDRSLALQRCTWPAAHHPARAGKKKFTHLGVALSLIHI